MESLLLAFLYLFFIVAGFYLVMTAILNLIFGTASKLGYFDRNSVVHEPIKDSHSYHLDTDLDIIHPRSAPTEYISYAQYQAYLLSPEWRTIAQIRLNKDNWTCQYCGSELRSMSDDHHTPNVHHLHYRNLTNEDIKNDLVSLCKSCHLDLHSRYSLTDMEFHINLERMKRNSVSS